MNLLASRNRVTDVLNTRMITKAGVGVGRAGGPGLTHTYTETMQTRELVIGRCIAEGTLSVLRGDLMERKQNRGVCVCAYIYI